MVFATLRSYRVLWLAAVSLSAAQASVTSSTSEQQSQGVMLNSFRRLQTSLSSISAISGSLTAPFVQSGSYVELPESANTAGGSIEFAMTCTQSSQLTFQMDVISPDGKSDSVYINVDSATPAEWHTGTYQAWTWSSASPSISFTQGDHRLWIKGREDGIKIRTMKIASGSGCEFQATARQAVEDAVLLQICKAASSSACEAKSADAVQLHGIQCTWATDRCEIHSQEPTCQADNLATCQQLASTSSDTCVWSGSMCYAFKPLTSRETSAPNAGWTCDFKDPATCEPNVAVALAANGQVDPAASETFDWNERQAELVKEIAVEEVIGIVGEVPFVGGILTRLLGLANGFAGTDTSQALCSSPGESTGECLFRHIADYLKIYVEEVLVEEKYLQLQHLINGASLQFTYLRNLIEPLGADLEELRREDVPESTRNQIDASLENNQHSMSVSLHNDFMSGGTTFAPIQATYTASYATATFQIWASQILFDPNYNTTAYVANLVLEIDRVTEWVLGQMAAAKEKRLDSVASEAQSGGESDPGPRGWGRNWYDLEDDFNKCPWTERVQWSYYQCGTRGCGSQVFEQADETARLCLMQRGNWVSWSQDVFWREALQVHLAAWEDLKQAALRWPTKAARRLVLV